MIFYSPSLTNDQQAWGPVMADGELPKIDPNLACRCDDDNFSSFFVGRAAMIQGLAGKFAPD